MSKLVKRILIGLVAILVIMQFFRIDKNNPPVDTSKEFMTLMSPPAEIGKMMKDACYDCHSHETKYPWYTNVAPVSWWVKNHIVHGRKKLNFSLWGDYPPKRSNHKLEEGFEEVEAEHMPLKSYLWAHPEARLSNNQRAKLVKWFKAAYERTKPESTAPAAPKSQIEKKGEVE